MTEERIMAIDFGLKRVGLALCDPLKIFAYPYKTIPNDNELITSIKSEIIKNNVVTVLLGYPLKEDGTKSASTLMVEKFKQEIDKSIDFAVILRDERYSSSIARENIIASVSGKKKRRDKGLIDRNAAAIILQEYLDEIQKTG